MVRGLLRADGLPLSEWCPGRPRPIWPPPGLPENISRSVAHHDPVYLRRYRHGGLGRHLRQNERATLEPPRRLWMGAALKSFMDPVRKRQWKLTRLVRAGHSRDSQYLLRT